MCSMFASSLFLTSYTSLCLCLVLWNQLVWICLVGTCKTKTIRVISAAVRHLLISWNAKQRSSKEETNVSCFSQ